MIKNILDITESAANRIKYLIDKRAKQTAGIRVAIRTKGCSGLSYVVEYADEYKKGDEIVTQHGVTVFIDPKAVLFLVGSKMDFEDKIIESGFTFRNPNEKGKCGCGQSFTV